MDEYQAPRNTRSSRRSGKNQRNMVAFAVIAVVLLVIGGIIDSAIQGGRVKKANQEREDVVAQLGQLTSMYQEQIATLESEIAAKQAKIDELSSAAPVTTAPDTQNNNTAPNAAPEAEGRRGNGLITFIIIFIIVILVISAIYISYNAFKKRDDEDDEDYDDDDDDYEYDDEDDDDDYDYEDYDLDDDDEE